MELFKRTYYCCIICDLEMIVRVQKFAERHCVWFSTIDTVEPYYNETQIWFKTKLHKDMIYGYLRKEFPNNVITESYGTFYIKPNK